MPANYDGDSECDDLGSENIYDINYNLDDSIRLLRFYLWLINLGLVCPSDYGNVSNVSDGNEGDDRIIRKTLDDDFDKRIQFVRIFQYMNLYSSSIVETKNSWIS